MPESNTVLYAAKEFLGRGFSIIPIGQDKKPVKGFSWKEYQTRKPTQEEVEEWWGKKYPGANLAIVMGTVSNLCAVDIDEEVGYGEIANYFPLDIKTPVVKTKKGIHFYFRLNGRKIGNRIRNLPGTDFKGEGGYVIAPPSVLAGHTYAFAEGLSMGDVEVADLPEAYARFLSESSIASVGLGKDSMVNKGKVNNITNIYSLTNGMSYLENKETPSNGGTPDPNPSKNNNNAKNSVIDLSYPCHSLSSSVIDCHTSPSIPRGQRDDTLFHLALIMAKGGASDEEILFSLIPHANQCGFPLGELKAKVQSARERAGRKERNLAAEVKEWVDSSSGWFTVTQVYQDLCVTDRASKQIISNALSRMASRKEIERDNTKTGRYRTVDDSVEVLDPTNVHVDPLDLEFPLGIHEYYQAMRKNIAIVAGEPDSGKSAFLLNFAALNADRYPVNYFSSEMGNQELASRLQLFDEYPMTHWKKVRFRGRASDFDDVIRPDEINVIDFLEVHDEFYKVGGMIKRIFDKLTTGFCFIAIQKNRGADFGLGGQRGLEKARLYITMGRAGDSNRVKIVKAKNWVQQGVNPNGLSRDFLLTQGCKFLAKTFWRKEEKKTDE